MGLHCYLHTGADSAHTCTAAATPSAKHELQSRDWEGWILELGGRSRIGDCLFLVAKQLDEALMTSSKQMGRDGG